MKLKSKSTLDYCIGNCSGANFSDFNHIEILIGPHASGLMFTLCSTAKKFVHFICMIDLTRPKFSAVCFFLLVIDAETNKAIGFFRPKKKTFVTG